MPPMATWAVAVGVSGGWLAPSATGQSCLAQWSDEFPQTQLSLFPVRSAVVFDDGKGAALYVANGALFRWRSERWELVDAGGSGQILSLASFDDDGGGPHRARLFAGGTFSVIGGVVAPGLAMWDGAAWSTVGAGVGWARTFTQSANGHPPALYAAVANQGVTRIARWDGVAWSLLDGGFVGFGSWDPPDVGALAWVEEGAGPALYAGGAFTSIGGAPIGQLARWNGDNWSQVGGGVHYLPSFPVVYALAPVADAGGPRLVVGGRFDTAGAVAAKNVAKWDGAHWSALGSGLSHPAVGSEVYSLTAFDDGAGTAVWASGTFAAEATGAGGIPRGQVAKWNGASWLAMEHSPAQLRRIYGLFATTDAGLPALFAYGDLGFIDNMRSTGAAKFQSGAWHRLQRGFDNTVSAMATLHAPSHRNSLYIGGRFYLAGNIDAPGIVGWDGSQFFALPGLQGAVHALAAFDDGTGAGPMLFAGGAFTVSSPGAPAGVVGVARWNGSEWTVLGGAGETASVRALAVFDDGAGPALYGAGRFSTPGRDVVARWNGNGWETLAEASGFASAISSLAVFGEGSAKALYVGGLFSSPGAYFARWDGHTWVDLGAGLDGPVSAMKVVDGGPTPGLYVGGEFSGGLRRFDGGVLIPVAGSGGLLNGPVSGIGTTTEKGWGPTLYVSGGFTAAGNQPLGRIARWNGRDFSPLATGLDGPAFAIQSFDDGGGLRLFVGGDFRSAGGNNSAFLAAWNACGCYVNCDGSVGTPSLNIGDFMCFLGKWIASDPYANCDGSTTAPVLNINDFICFQQKFAAGCP